MPLEMPDTDMTEALRNHVAGPKTPVCHGFVTAGTNRGYGLISQRFHKGIFAGPYAHMCGKK
jgi:hypothetical protein